MYYIVHSIYTVLPSHVIAVLQYVTIALVWEVGFIRVPAVYVRSRDTESFDLLIKRSSRVGFFYE